LVLDVPVEQAFAACMTLLRSPDAASGVVARRLDPDPPVAGGSMISTVRRAQGDDQVVATIAVLDPPRQVATESGVEGGAAVRTSLRCEPRQDGGTVVILTSEAASSLPLFGRGGRVLESLLLGGSQRRHARATMQRLRELAASPGSGGSSAASTP